MNNMKLAKRIMAMALALSMMLTTLGGYAPGWFTAFAEDAEAQIEVQTEENPASDSEKGEPAKPEKADEAPSEEASAETVVEQKAEEPAEASVEEEAEEPAAAPVEQKAEEPVEAPIEEKIEESSSAPVEEEAEEPTEASMEEEAEELTEASVEEETEEPAEATIEEETEEPTEVSIEEEAEEPAEASVEEEVEEPAETSVEEKAEEPTEVSVEEEAEEPTEASVEEEAQEPAETSVEEKTEEPTEVSVEEDAEEPAEVSVEEEAEEPAEAPAEEVIGEPEEDQAIPTAAIPARFTLMMAAPARAAVQQADEESDDADETIEITEPALEVSNVAATMAVPRANAVLMAASPAEQASDSAANEETTDETEVPQTADRTAALQQLVKDKIAALTTLSGIVQIVLAKNTTFEGDVEVEKSEDQTVSDDFQLQLIAEDALDENGAVIEAGGSGKTVVSGNLKISGLNVLMRGIMMALGKKVTVSDATLTYEGTGEADVLEVELASNGSAQINTYAGEDNVSVALYDGARNAEVDTGDDDDKVSVTGYDGSAKIETGDGDDIVDLNLQSGTGAVNVDTGAGDDKVEAKIASRGTSIKTGEGADIVEIDAQYGSDDINVVTGAGDDRVSVKKSDDLYAAKPSGKMTIDLGSGASRLDVDLSVGKSYATIDAVADKASGSRLHLTGTLNGSTDAVAEDKRIEWASGAKDGIVLHPAGGATLTISGVNNFYTLTDALGNKRTKNVSSANGVFEDFTNYTLDDATDKNGVKSWKGNTAASGNLALTNLVLGKGQEDIKVGDVDATGFNLLIQGKEIDLSGTVKAQNLVVVAKDEHDISLKLESEDILGKIGDFFEWIGDNFHQNIVRTAAINVGKNAKLYATNDIDLSAQVEQSGGLLNSDLLTMVVNPVNVKIGTAEVNIASGAQLAAGYGANGNSAPSGSGSITAEAKVTTDMSAGDGKLSLPVAVNVAVQNASVEVAKNAVLKAAGNINVSAESKIEAKAEAPSKAASKDVPFAVAVNVILNNATADVNGKLTAGKDVTVSALGDMTSEATAKHKGDSLSGVFVGVNVPLQNVRALLGESAVVNAGGAVSVKSTANEKATTIARSGSAPAGDSSDEGEAESYATEKEDSGFDKTKDIGLGMVKEYIGGPLGSLWGKIKDKVGGLFKDAPTESEKLDSMMKSVSGGNYTVKLAEDSEQKGDVKFTTGPREGYAGTYTEVDITPWEGYQVDKVYYVYLDNQSGEDATTKYTVEALDWDDYDDADGFYIPQKNANVLVYVTYKEGSYAADDPDNWTPDDLFNENDDDYSQDLQSLFDDATSGAQNTDDDDYGEDLQRLFDEDAADGDTNAGDKLKFSIEPTDTKDNNGKTVGSILNVQFSKSTGESITTVDKNGKVTFIVNAKNGYKLKDDGLVVTYYIEGEDKEQKAVLKDDGNGRYTFAVPDGIRTNKYSGGIAFKVVSEFEGKEGEASNNVDQTETQFNGSVAVTVAMNDNRAEIQSGASVTAGDAVNVTADEETKVDTNTDGSGVVKNPEPGEGGGGGEKKEQEDQQKLLSGQYIVTGKEVSLTLDRVSGGTVDVQQSGAYGYTFTPKQNGAAVKGATATLRYQKNGEWQSETLTANSDGTYSVNLSAYAIDKGTQAVLGFAMPGGSSESQAKRDLVDYTMNVSYNVFQLSKEEDPYNVGNRKIGKVYYVKTTGTGTGAKYYFDIQPDWAKGYTMDGSSTNNLWASYTDGSGKEQKVALHQDANSKYWYVQASDLTGIAQGGNVTVNVRFREDKHDIVIPDGTTKNGTLTFSDDSAKATDVITIKATPDANYGAGKITVHYTNKNTGRTETVELTPDEDGEAKFTMPVLADATSLYVSAVFNEKTLTIKKDAQSKDVSIDTSVKVSAGESIAVALTDEAVQAGKKLNATAQVTYTDKDGSRKTVQVDVKDGKIALPDDVADRTDVQIAVNAVEKAIALNGGEVKLDHGTLKIASTRADKGEKVVVTITPEAGYRFKQGSGTVEITTSTSTYKVKLTRKDDSSLTFTMPSSMTSAELTEAKVNVTLKGEFEKGNPDSSSFETSIGAAAAVAVVNAKNRAAVTGGAVKADAVNVTAVTVGESKTSASAGYSKAVTGLAGGFGVQVSSFDTDALVKQAASIDAKALTVSAQGTHGFETTGSATGAKDAGTTGVGSGIAVNVSSADVTAAVQDGTTVNMGGGRVEIAAANQTSDKVTAKAGAKGETGVTPVIGVDVFGSSASAYLGNVKGTVLNAKTVSVTANNNAAHDMVADASTGGGSVALGGAFAVTVIHDESLARLNTSVKNAAADGAITVSATTNATQSVTATAGVSGGVKGTAGKNGSAGSADKQVDSILGGAGSIAAGNKSNSLSMKGSGSADRQKAQTSEGSVGGAAAVAVNVLSTGAVARVMDGSTIDIGGALAVKSVNRTQTKVKANGSTAKTDTGVGVAVAVNIVDIENTAEIGTGAVTAGSLEVSALMPEKADNAVDEMTTVKMPESKDAMVAQLANYIKDGINDALSELGVDQSVIGELAAEFSETFVEYVLKETGLDELLGDGTFDEKVDKVLGDLNDLWESVKDYPTVLLEPLNTLKDEITALEDVDVDQLKDILLGELKTQLPNLLKNTAMAVLNRAKDDLGALALEGVNNKIKGKDQSSTKEKAKETLKNAVKAEWTKLSNELMNDALTRLRSEVPALTQQNIDYIKYMFTSSLDEKKDGFVNYFTDTFQTKVFNYSAVMDKISNTDFMSAAKEMMRGALNASTAKVGNAAIESLVSGLDVQLEPEDVSDKHVIRTEAISGAAAKDVGIAGSVAIAIVNANTRAVVNSGSAGDNLNITGDAVVDAREARRVTTTASAALDSNGDADTNADAGKKEEKDTAGSEAAQTVHLGEQLQVKAAAGAELEQDASDKNIVWITPRDGWKIAAGANKATWAYTDDKGEEKTGKIQVYSKTVNGETKYYVKASDAKTASGQLTTITVTPEEDLHTITGLDAINLSENDATKGKVPNGAVSVTVDGRDEAVKDGKLSARVTDTVKISIDKTKLNGLKVDSIDYITADGKIHEVPLSSTENGNQIVFTFTMPAQNVTGILVEVDEAGDTDAITSQTAATDSKGRSVGVGASFAMVYGDSNVTATINRNVTAGSLNVNAESDHVDNTASVSGTDVLTGESNIDAMKQTSVDASVALDILDNQVKAALTGTASTTKGDLALTAGENAVSETRASGYAVGSETAVGAAVAVNIASSAVNAEAMKDLSVAGGAKIDANSHSEDVTRALATAMGADIARAMNKVGTTADKLEEKSNDLLQGKLFDGKTDGGDNKDNQTADKINERLDKKKAEGGESSSKNLSLSSNALRNQNVTTEGENAGSEGTNEGLNQIKENNGTDLNGVGGDTKTKVQVAAAVGVTVAGHEAAVNVGRIIATGDISATAENTGNFNTLGTGAAMSLAQKANSIALGVAVSVNENKAKVHANGDLASAEAGDVTLKSNLTQNMDGDFRGKLAAQSLAGSVAGSDSTVSLGGAVSVLVSNAESTVDMVGKTITGKAVTIEATDKSKLAARAGGVSLSRGSSVGMGIASTTIVSANEVTANVGDGATITADSFKLNAQKKAVTDADYKSNIDMRYLITDSSALNDEQRKEANTGLIDVHKGKDDDSYDVDVNLSTDKLLDAADALNFLSSQNTYAEAVAGSVALGKTKASLAGAFAVAVTDNHVKATLGKNVTVKANNGDADITATDGATTRIIAGSLSAAPAKASVGATVAVLVNGDVAEAVTGENATINASGDVNHTAGQTGDAQLFTAALAVAAGVDAKAAVGGAINVIVNKSTAHNAIGAKSTLNAGKDVNIDSQAQYDLMLISGNANVTGGGSVAAGGTVNVIVDKTEAATKLGNNDTVIAGRNVSVSSDVSDQLISGALSASVAASTDGKSGAGAVNVIVSKSVADTALEKGAVLASGADTAVTANNDAWMLNATLAAAVGSGAAIGGTFNVNVFDRQATVALGNAAITAVGNLKAQSGGRDTTIMAGLGGSGSVSSAAVAGTVNVLVESNKIHTETDGGITAQAGKSAVLESYFSDYTVAMGGNIALGGGNAVGASANTVIKKNDVQTLLGSSSIAAKEGDAENLSGETVSGIYVGANANETQFLGAASGTAGLSNSINGVVDVLVNSNTVVADASKAALGKADWDVSKVYVQFWKTGVTGYYWYGTFTMNQFMNTYVANLLNGKYRTLKYRAADGKLYTVDKENLDLSLAPLRNYETDKISVVAKDDTKQILLAGGVEIGSSLGLGASVVTLVSDKDVKALAHDMQAKGDITVSADNKDDVTLIAVNAGAGSNAVAVGAVVEVLKSKAIANVGSSVMSSEGSVAVKAHNDTQLLNAAAAVAFGGSAAVTPVAVVTYFEGEARANVESGSEISAAKDVNIESSGDKNIDLYAAGAAIGGSAGVSGAAAVLVSKDTTQAVAAKDTVIHSKGRLTLDAQSDYTLRSASAAIGVAGTAGVGISAVVSVLNSNVTSELAGKANAQGVSVTASGKRDVISAGASLAGGTAGVGVTAMVLVAGTKMSQDAADSLTYGNADDKNDKQFDADKLMQSIAKGDGGGSKYYANDVTLADDTQGNGHRESDESVGGNATKGEFDGSSGYRSADFDNQNYKDDGSTQRGENLEAKDTADVKAAKNMNTYTYKSDPTDAVIARVAETAAVTAKKVEVVASQPVTADLIGASVGAGVAGIGVGVAVGMLRSNVLASSQGAITGATEGITVKAESKSGTLENDDNAGQRDATVSDLLDLGDKLNPSNRAIRAVGVSLGAGVAGVAVGVAVTLTDNITQATLGGTVTGAGKVDVTATHKYGSVLAATGAVSGGVAAVNASASVAQANGTVKAVMTRGLSLSGTGDVNLSTDADVTVDSVAATVGGGLVAVNAGVALAFNRLTQETGIEAGTSITTTKNLNVTAASTSAANSYLMGVSAGAVAVNLNAAVSDVSAKIDTYMGQSIGTKAGDTSSTTPEAVIAANKVTLKNTVSSTALPVILSFNAGGVAASGNALLAFSQTEASVLAENVNVTAKDMDVIGNLSGTATSSLTTAQVGAAAIGLSVNYADMQAQNRASLNNSTVKLTGNLRVLTNDGGQSTKATANTVTGSVGFVTAGLNAAIARNHTMSYATIISDKPIDVAGTLTVAGKGASTAVADMTGLAIGVRDIAATAVVALNDADARTTVVGNHIQPAGGMILDAAQDGATTAAITQGGGSLISAKLNVALAYGRTNSIVDVAIAGGGNIASVKSTNKARDNTTATVSNNGYSGISAAAMFGGAYSQDIFSTKIQLTGGDYTLGSVDVLLDYDLNTTAKVQPSPKGVNVSLASLGFNMAVAKNTAYAGSDLEISIPEFLHQVNGDVKVKTVGSDEVSANVYASEISVGGITAGGNIANADLSATQSAVMRVGGNVYISGDVDVQSLVRSANANANVGANTKGTTGVSVSLGNINVSRATANENLSNTAALLGAAYGAEERAALVDMGDYVTRTVTETDYDIIESVTYKMNSFDWTVTSTESEDAVLSQAVAYLYSNPSALKGFDATFFREDRYYRNNMEDGVRSLQTRLNLIAPYLVLDLQPGTVVWETLENFWKMQALSSIDREAFEWVKKYEGITDPVEAMIKINSYSAEDISRCGEYVIIQEMQRQGLLDWTVTTNYATVTHEVTEWVPQYELMTVEVPLYDTSRNYMSVDKGVNVLAGMADANGQTKAIARTDGAKGIGALSMGSLEANATSTDSVTAMIEGMRVAYRNNLNLSAVGNTAAYAVGFKSGGVNLLSVDHSTVKAMVGKPNDKQSVNVIVGDDVRLSGGFSSVTTIAAKNTGYAEASMNQTDTAWGAGNFKSSTQETESWYSTLISFGENTQVSYGDIVVRSEDSAGAKSAVDSSNVGILMNFNTMQGKNTIHQENNIDFGKNAYLLADRYKTGSTGKLLVEALQNTKAYAETISSGGGLIAGDTATARNTVDRVARVNMAPEAYLSADGEVTLRARSGVGDDIYTRAYVSSKGLASVANAKAYADVTSNDEIIIGNGADLRGDTKVVLEAIATSYKTKGSSSNEPGITTIGHVDALGVVAAPNGVAHNTLTFNTYIGINQDSNDKLSTINYHKGAPISILATNAGLTAKADAVAKGKGGFGVSNATAWNEVYLQNAVWIDNSTLSSGQDGKTISIRATNGDTGADRLHLIANAHAALAGLAGKVAPTSRISGTQVNQIRSNDVSAVRFNTQDTVEHIASNPKDIIWTEQKATYDRWEVKVWFATLTLTKATVVRDLNWNYFDRCDFCGTGQAVDVEPTAQDPMRERYEEAYKEAMDAIDRIRQKAGMLPVDASASLAYKLAKGLVPLTYLDTLLRGRAVNVVKARYGEEENRAAAEIFTLDLEVPLTQDVTLDGDRLNNYLIWTNWVTQHQVSMLPNSTRLYSKVKLDYVSEVLLADMRGVEGAPIDIFVALNANAFKDPVVPIGSAGSLDFASGTLLLPAKADFELYLHEVSGAWLLDQLETGIFRTYSGDIDRFTEYAVGEGEKLPGGTIIEGITFGGEEGEWKLYWLGDTPETAKDDRQTLVYLLYNEETDEIDAFRTSVEMIENGDEDIDVSLYIFRDSKADRMEEERYNIMFFDTPAGEKSLVKFITDVLEERVLEVPKPLRVVLRGFEIEGADWPVYSLTDHFFAMCDGTDGQVSMFGGFYSATFDGDVFDSDYTRIEGIMDGDLNVTIKQGQPIWPEWTGENTAEDIQGNRYVRVDGVWYPEEDAPEVEDEIHDDAVAA